MNILFYPSIRDDEVLTDLFHRCCWYLPDLAGTTVTFPVARTGEIGSKPDHFGDCPPPSFTTAVVDCPDNTTLLKHLAQADLVLQWNSELNRMEAHNLGAFNKRVIDVDRDATASRYEAYHFAILRHEILPLEERFQLKTQNWQKAKDVFAKLRTDKAYVFGTGPSLGDAMTIDCNDGVRIVCNGAVRNQALLDHLQPQVITMTDPALHYGVSAYAQQIRQCMVDALERYDAYLFVAMGYYPLFIRHYPHLADRVIGVPVVPAKANNLNLDLNTNFEIACYANVLTLFLLPLACSLAQEVSILGCDGRAPVADDAGNPSPFWAHHKASEFEEVYHTLQSTHPGFFALDYQDWYDDHCRNIEKMTRHAVAQGHRLRVLTRSYIPALIPYLEAPLQRDVTRQLADAVEPESPFELMIDTRSKHTYRVSVIVSLYDCERFIVPALRNLLEQTLYACDDVEIVLIDSASPGHERDLLQPYLDANAHLVYARTRERESVYGAFNRGIKLGRSEYIINLDTDNRFRANALELFANYLDAHPNVGVAYGNQFVGYHENESFGHYVRYGYLIRPDYEPSMMLHKFYFGSELMWRRELHEKIGYYDESYVVAGDYEMACRMATVTDFGHMDAFFGIYLKNLDGIEYSNPALCEAEDERVRAQYEDAFPEPIDPPRVHVHYPVNRDNAHDFVTIVCQTNSFEQSIEPWVNELVFGLEYPHILYSIDNNSSQETRDSIHRLVADGLLADGHDMGTTFASLFRRDLDYSPSIRFYVIAHGEGLTVNEDFRGKTRADITRCFVGAHEELMSRFHSGADGIDLRKVHAFIDHSETQRLDLCPHLELQKADGFSKDAVEAPAPGFTVIIQHYCPTGQEDVFREALRQCVASVRDQDDTGNCQIIVTDDGSNWSSALAPATGTEASMAWSRQQLANLHEFDDFDVDVWIYKSRTGFFSKGILWNAARTLAANDRLIFLDDDHRFLRQDALKLYDQHLAEHELVIGHTQSYHAYRDAESTHTIELGFESQTVQGSNFGIRRELLDRVGGFDNRTFWWGTGDDPALFWALYLALRPKSEQAARRACYVDDIVTDNPLTGRWQTDCRVDKRLFVKDFMRLHGVHPHSNPSRNRAAWVRHFPAVAATDKPIAKATPTIEVFIPILTDNSEAVSETIASVVAATTRVDMRIVLLADETCQRVLNAVPLRPDDRKQVGTFKGTPEALQAGLAESDAELVTWLHPPYKMSQQAAEEVLAIVDSMPVDFIVGTCAVDAANDNGGRVYGPSPGPVHQGLSTLAAQWLPGQPLWCRRATAKMLLKEATGDLWALTAVAKLGASVMGHGSQKILASVAEETAPATPRFLQAAMALSSASVDRLQPLADSLEAIDDIRQNAQSQASIDNWRAASWQALSRNHHQALTQLFERLHTDGVQRVAMYGAGQHTRDLLNQYAIPEKLTIVCIVDDYSHGFELCGIPVVSPNATADSIDAVVVSSDTVEEMLYQRAVALDSGPVYTIYGEYEPIQESA